MVSIARIALIGNSLPRRCGIATFTNDLQQALAASVTGMQVDIVAMTDHGHTYAYPRQVCHQIVDDRLADYVDTAAFLNAGGYDAVSLQHEFGIFGGEAGSNILATLSRLRMPVVTTLHTVLAAPTPVHRDTLTRVAAASTKLVVMAEKGRALLRTVYGVPDSKIELIPHGIPDVPFAEPDAAKTLLRYRDRAVILTFGLLSPNKGIEVVIDAMPAILQRCPEAVYVVLGATHPNLVRREGEAYREHLQHRVVELGLGEHVVFLNQFVDRPTLLDFISICDVYVTPYLNAAQMTSGTLAYSFGLGKAVVSTPYWHAAELLAEGRGVLVPFGDAAATGAAIAQLLTDHAVRLVMRRNAYSCSRGMTWPQTALRYLAAFEASRQSRSAPAARDPGQVVRLRERHPTPDMRTDHLRAMCDDTGLLQHAVHSVPNLAQGYCVDDNARALLVACALNAPGEMPLPERLVNTFAGFVQYAWNPDAKRFRNFMRYNRSWAEDVGSEDSHGRTLWALGKCARTDASASRRRWAGGLFREAPTATERFSSPRAWAFTLLGLDAYCDATDDAGGERMRTVLAARLLACLTAVETKSWTWFEDGLAYDNARLCQALIATGGATVSAKYVAAGLRSLRWLLAVQKSRAGMFRPVGSAGFGACRTPPSPFDQQPLEATATISACIAAWRLDGDRNWLDEAQVAFAWFLGENDLALPVVDVETGSCRDGLHPDRRNENRGAESTLSYLLSLAEIRALANAGLAAIAPALGAGVRMVST